MRTSLISAKEFNERKKQWTRIVEEINSSVITPIKLDFYKIYNLYDSRSDSHDIELFKRILDWNGFKMEETPTEEAKKAEEEAKKAYEEAEKAYKEAKKAEEEAKTVVETPVETPTEETKTEETPTEKAKTVVETPVETPTEKAKKAYEEAEKAYKEAQIQRMQKIKGVKIFLK